jgi:hypothetical protein
MSGIAGGSGMIRRNGSGKNDGATAYVDGFRKGIRPDSPKAALDRARGEGEDVQDDKTRHVRRDRRRTK